MIQLKFVMMKYRILFVKIKFKDKTCFIKKNKNVYNWFLHILLIKFFSGGVTFTIRGDGFNNVGSTTVERVVSAKVHFVLHILGSGTSQNKII